jgi:hypothetical protein
MLTRGFRLLCALVVIGGLAPSMGWAQPYWEHGHCGAVPGVWQWFSGHNAYFYPDGTARGGEGTVSATWSCSAGRVVIYWSNGGADRLALAPGGQYLSGFNQVGTHIWGRRIGDL